jgi:hypothetical protein
MQLITAFNEELQRYLERQEAPMRHLSAKIVPVGYQKDFLARLRSATYDDRWHLRRCAGDSLALCLTVPEYDKFEFSGARYRIVRDGFYPWKCFRTGSLDETVIYYAKWHSYKNIKLMMREMSEAEATKANDEKRRTADAAHQLSGDIVNYGLGYKRHFV